MKQHQCPDCGEVYECKQWEDKCIEDYDLRCTQCQRARARHYVGLAKAAAAYGKHVREGNDD